MKLALFTPGAYIWPVVRNFEVFISSLASSSGPALRIAESNIYPAGSAPPRYLEEGQADRRLRDLHSHIYWALLRPHDFFDKSDKSVADEFWPDMVGSPSGDLLDAFTAFFVNERATAISVRQGLAVLRAVFFNHEASEPEHWVHTSLSRLDPERTKIATFNFELDTPVPMRAEDTSFMLAADLDRPITSAGWIRGRMKRHSAGTCRISVSCGLDPSVDPAAVPEHVAGSIEREAGAAMGHVFGWPAAAQSSGEAAAESTA